MKQTKVITLSLAIFIISICCFGYENRILVPKLYNVQITADGKLDEPVWQKAAVFDNLVKTSTHEKVTDKDTQLLMFFDTTNVYISINCKEPTGIISAPINDNSRFGTATAWKFSSQVWIVRQAIGTIRSPLP